MAQVRCARPRPPAPALKQGLSSSAATAAVTASRALPPDSSTFDRFEATSPRFNNHSGGAAQAVSTHNSAYGHIRAKHAAWRSTPLSPTLTPACSASCSPAFVASIHSVLSLLITPAPPVLGRMRITRVGCDCALAAGIRAPRARARRLRPGCRGAHRAVRAPRSHRWASVDFGSP